MTPIISDGLTVGNALSEFRRRAGLSARQLSLRSGLSESYVGKVEKGEISPSLSAFALIVFELGLPPNEMYLLLLRSYLEARYEYLDKAFSWSELCSLLNRASLESAASTCERCKQAGDATSPA